MKLTEFEKEYDLPCRMAYKWATDAGYTIEEAWNNCHRGDWLLWVAYKVGVDDRLFTKAKALCANTVRHLVKDKRGINAIDVALKYAEGKATKDELSAAAADAIDAAYAADSADAAYFAAWAAAYAADFPAWAAADAVDFAAAKKENQQQTADICREVLTKEVFELLQSKLQDDE